MGTSQARLLKSLRNTGHGDKIKGPRFRNLVKIFKKSLKIASFFRLRFWKRFGSLLGGVWEAKISDFRTFFVIFSSQKSNRNFGRQQKQKKLENGAAVPKVKRNVQVQGGRIYRMGGAQHASNFKFSL